MTALLDHAPCTRCEGTVVDPLDDGGLAACCYCGLLVRLPRLAAAAAAKARPASTPADGFRLQYGRFAGLTLQETADQPNGLRYLEALAKGNDKLRGMIEDFLRPQDFALDARTPL